MDFEQLARERYSCRAFKDQPVPEAMLLRVLEAGRIAPTACNKQPQRVKIVRTPEELEKIDQCISRRFGAPVVLVVCYDAKACWVRKDGHAASGEIDASIAATHLMLQAHDLGLGTTWVMDFDAKKAAKLFDLPKHVAPVAMLPLGWPAQDAAPSEWHARRQPIEGMLL